MTIETRIKKLIVDQFGSDKASAITPETTFIDDLAADDLDRLEFAMAIEQEFGVELDDDDLENMRTVGDAVKLIDRATAERVS